MEKSLNRVANGSLADHVPGDNLEHMHNSGLQRGLGLFATEHSSTVFEHSENVGLHRVQEVVPDIPDNIVLGYN
jgi:hypothetical protein